MLKINLIRERNKNMKTAKYNQLVYVIEVYASLLLIVGALIFGAVQLPNYLIDSKTIERAISK